uniref:Secreted protein n=1 Tax=Arundo donax TaxID=35708 RepID=A0A0A9CTA7_ARUDO
MLLFSSGSKSFLRFFIIPPLLLFLDDLQFWSLSTFCTRVENFEHSQMFFSLRMHGGFHEGGGTIRQIPNGSAIGRILSMYFKVSSNSSSVG